MPSSAKWSDIDTAPRREELALFFCLSRFSSDSDPWTVRCNKWDVHGKLFARIKDAGDGKAGKLTTSRISFLDDHLDVLDTKIGYLLNFNTLLLIAINVMFGVLHNFVKPDNYNAYHCLVWSFICLSILFGVLWLVITGICLAAERRLVWGELGLDRQTHQTADPEKLKEEQLPAVEDDHAKALIVAIVKRSNKFRIASDLTFLNIMVLGAAIVSALALLGNIYL